jgi:hypothetical protein
METLNHISFLIFNIFVGVSFGYSAVQACLCPNDSGKWLFMAIATGLVFFTKHCLKVSVR